MANKYKLSCATNKPGNTGFNGSCFPDIKQILGAFIVPVDLVIPEVSLTKAGILTYLRTAALNDNSFARVYPVHNFIGTATNGGDRREFTAPYGSRLTTGENDYGFRHEYTAGGMQLQGQLRAFNSNGGWAIVYYDKDNLYFFNNGDGTASGQPTTTTWSEALTPNNGTDPTLYHFYVGMKAQYLNDDIYIQPYTGNPSSIKGLQDVDIIVVDFNEATGVANVKLQVGEIDLYDQYDDEFASAAMYTAFNAVTNNAITITSVAKNAGAKGWTITISTVDADYPSSTQGIKLDIVGPTELNTADVPGYASSGEVILPTT
jgi:hypothetical protein